MILPKVIRQYLELEIKKIILDVYQDSAMSCVAMIGETIDHDQFKGQIRKKVDTSTKDIISLIENIGK